MVKPGRQCLFPVEVLPYSWQAHQNIVRYFFNVFGSIQIMAFSRKLMCSLAGVILSSSAFAASLPGDFSGTYACKGQDKAEGPYDGVVELERVAAQSTLEYSAYRFKLTVPGFGEYPGHASSRGSNMAIYFANTDPKDMDYGTGIASFKLNSKGVLSFTKFYYQPLYKGGNNGTEICTRTSGKPN